MSDPSRSAQRQRYIERVLIAFGIGVVLFLIWKVFIVLVLIFGGVLVAVVLHALAGPLHRWLRLPSRWALVVSVALIVLLLAFIGGLIGQKLGEQVGQLAEQLPPAVDHAERWLRGTGLGRALLGAVTSGGKEGRALSGIAGFASSTFGGLAYAILIIFLGVYFAADPALYRDGALRLVPAAARPRVRDAMNASGQALTRWLFGQLIAMAVVGVVVGTGLWLMGVPLAMALGLLAALLEFIPFVGPIAFSIPGILLAFLHNPGIALWVALFYLLVQQSESNILMPILQRWMVALPPALGVLAVVVFALLFGPVGVLFATPLMVVMIVTVKKLYVEAAIEDKPPPPQPPPATAPRQLT